MTGDEVVLAVIEAIEKTGIPYMIVGSFSSNLYGIPRATQDVDFVIELGETPLSEFTSNLPPWIILDRQISFETVTMTKRLEAVVLGSEFKIELFLLSTDLHDQERFRRRRRMPLLGRLVYVPTAEDVLITKLNWILHANRGKDREDVRDVIAVQKDNLDWDYLTSWCERHGSFDILKEIRDSISSM